MTGFAPPSPAPSPILRSPVGFLLIPEFTVIGLSSAIEPLRIANRYLESKYRWRLLSIDGRAVADDNGILIHAEASLDDPGAIGTLMICADLRPERFVTRAVVRRLRALDRAGVVLGAIDTGAFVLARAGLLDGHRVTMHWEQMEVFSERYPTIEPAGTLFEMDARRLSCAGGTAALDMMLTAIGIDHGDSLAQRVADHCLHERIRSGSTRQRGNRGERECARHPGLRRALRLLAAHPGRAYSNSELARECALSVRHLTRLFEQELGQSPREHQRVQRLDRARTLLRNGEAQIAEVALAAGFKSPAHFSRAYRALFDHAPSSERKACAPAPRLVMDRGE